MQRALIKNIKSKELPAAIEGKENKLGQMIILPVSPGVKA